MTTEGFNCRERWEQDPAGPATKALPTQGELVLPQTPSSLPRLPTSSEPRSNRTVPAQHHARGASPGSRQGYPAPWHRPDDLCLWFSLAPPAEASVQCYAAQRKQIMNLFFHI